MKYVVQVIKRILIFAIVFAVLCSLICLIGCSINGGSLAEDTKSGVAFVYGMAIILSSVAFIIDAIDSARFDKKHGDSKGV